MSYTYVQKICFFFVNYKPPSGNYIHVRHESSQRSPPVVLWDLSASSPCDILLAKRPSSMASAGLRFAEPFICPHPVCDELLDGLTHFEERAFFNSLGNVWI